MDNSGRRENRLEPTVRKWRGCRWTAAVVVALSGLFYFGFAGLVWCWGDTMWLGTVLLFSPRYLLAWPLLVVAAVIPFGNRWSQAVACGIIGFSLTYVCGFCFPWERAWPYSGQTIRVLTLNAGGSRLNAADFESLLEVAKPDLVLLQEFTGRQEVSWPKDWSTCVEGDLVIASRYPLTLETIVRRRLPGRWPRPVAMFATAQTPQGDFRAGTLHFLSPRQGLSEIVSSRTILNVSKRGQIEEEIQWRTNESARVAQAVSEEGGIILGGDFNMPADSKIYSQDWGAFRNAFSRSGFGFGNTVFVKQDRFTFAARIDHILFTRHWHSTKCWVGQDVGSDHRPLISELRRSKSAG